MSRILYDVAVIGAGPAGAQAAVSAAHQMRHVLVLDAAPISQRKGRAYWSKSVEIQDAPVFERVTGPRFARALQRWMGAQPVRAVTIGGRERLAGIEYRPGVVLRVRPVPPEPDELAPAGHLLELEVSTRALPTSPAPRARPAHGEGDQGAAGQGQSAGAQAPPAPAAPPASPAPLHVERFYARTVVVASGFEDVWPDIEVEPGVPRLYQRYRTLFRYAGNRKGWHVCIRCDGHLHVDEHLAILAAGDLAWGIARGAQDFTDRMTILTNGRPHGFTSEQLEVLQQRGIKIEEEAVVAHMGKGTDLLGLRLADGRELYFDGFLLDYGLQPNTEYLRPEDGWALQRDEDGLLVIDEDGQVLDEGGTPVPGLFAAGDIVAGQRNLIATAFGLGQNAGLSASDLMREW
ncbi:MAG TPA: NAD(P)/FAD-dependent oxidoreductase [Chloroflexota bacterium]|nr:NAD(P)/FAD-dependent oxidoreductase [Chloroflexota bacterium]